MSQLKPGTAAIEACGGAHHLGRRLRDAGFEVRLMSPEYVRSYMKAQKNDDRAAEAIAEAATLPTMRFVELNAAAEPEWLAGPENLAPLSALPGQWSASTSDVSRGAPAASAARRQWIKEGKGAIK